MNQRELKPMHGQINSHQIFIQALNHEAQDILNRRKRTLQNHIHIHRATILKSVKTFSSLLRSSPKYEELNQSPLPFNLPNLKIRF